MSGDDDDDDDDDAGEDSDVAAAAAATCITSSVTNTLWHQSRFENPIARTSIIFIHHRGPVGYCARLWQLKFTGSITSIPSFAPR